MPKTLRLTLKLNWFKMICAGEKLEEYREFKEFWEARLMDRSDVGLTLKKWDFVEFQHGYTKNAPRVILECLGVKLGKSSHPEWGGNTERIQFIIKLGKIISISNYGN